MKYGKKKIKRKKMENKENLLKEEEFCRKWRRNMEKICFLSEDAMKEKIKKY